ncbi:lipopolysaccharide heptosyltransferase II [Endozoicomonas numazuensis]|uniref:lipopolysaccharide heptosyltransferase II n=1 Tax=Endozoicomonas numazuensis TaxID=1137799 RepID=A0A081NIL4_9GAMM|nr:lipopolysaccharide heptosyltransferase II [Endozoicomonas numazuensis]KEQ18287.1 ADP-heptose--LPS heptosyltransferase [Endozoicomonas numazuensis]
MKYLIVGPSWVGDMVMAQTLFIALKRQHPDAIIDVLAPAWSRPIIERMPEVRSGIDMPVGHGSLNLGVRSKIAKNLKAEGYDRAILLPNSLKSALIPFLAGIPVRTGWRGEMRYGLLNDLRVLDKAQYPLMVERFIALAYPDKSPLPSPLPKPSLNVESDNVVNALHRYQLSKDLPILALCPGAEFGPSKQWPAGYYGEVALTMIQKGWQIWLFGSEKDQPVTNEIMGYLPRNLQERCFNLAGQTTLADAVDLMSQASAVVSNDSGLMHIAAALSRPLVAVYGSTTAAHTPPMNDNSETLWLGLDCSPCFKRECPLEHLNCMKKLGPEMVLDALERLSGEQTLEIQG